MEGEYLVAYQGKTVGKVQVIQQGLYYRVICRCQVPQSPILRLYGVWEDKRENLGVVLPAEKGAALDKKILAKRFGQGQVQFQLCQGAGNLAGRFVPISPEEPFEYIERLKTSFLESRQGKIGIRIYEPPEAV